MKLINVQLTSILVVISLKGLLISTTILKRNPTVKYSTEMKALTMAKEHESVDISLRGVSDLAVINSIYDFVINTKSVTEIRKIRFLARLERLKYKDIIKYEVTDLMYLVKLFEKVHHTVEESDQFKNRKLLIHLTALKHSLETHIYNITLNVLAAKAVDVHKLTSESTFSRITKFLSDLPIEIIVRLTKVCAKNWLPSTNTNFLLPILNMQHFNRFKLYLMQSLYWELKAQRLLNATLLHSFGLGLKVIKKQHSFNKLTHFEIHQIKNMEQSLPLYIRVLYFSSNVCLENKDTLFYLTSTSKLFKDTDNFKNLQLGISLGAQSLAFWNTISTEAGDMLVLTDVFDNDMILFPNKKYHNFAVNKTINWILEEYEKGLYTIRSSNHGNYFCVENGQSLLSKADHLEKNCLWIIKNCTQFAKAVQNNSRI